MQSAGQKVQFIMHWHHVYDVALLREPYLGLKRNAAPGVYRARASAKRGVPSHDAQTGVYIPKPDGRQRPLGVTALENKSSSERRSRFATLSMRSMGRDRPELKQAHAWRSGRRLGGIAQRRLHLSFSSRSSLTMPPIRNSTNGRLSSRNRSDETRRERKGRCRRSSGDRE